MPTKWVRTGFGEIVSRFSWNRLFALGAVVGVALVVASVRQTRPGASETGLGFLVDLFVVALEIAEGWGRGALGLLVALVSLEGLSYAARSRGGRFAARALLVLIGSLGFGLLFIAVIGISLQGGLREGDERFVFMTFMFGLSPWIVVVDSARREKKENVRQMKRKVLSSSVHATVTKLRAAATEQGWEFSIISESPSEVVYNTRAASGNAWRRILVKQLPDGRTEVSESA